MADYLKADDFPHLAGEVTRTFASKNPRALETWKYLKTQTNADFRAELMKYHFMLRKSVSMAQQLEGMARCVHLYVVRFNVQHADTSCAAEASLAACAGFDDLYPSMLCDIDERPVTKHLPALLPAVTELRGIQLLAKISDPGAHANSAAAAKLCCAALSTLTQLESVFMLVPATPPHSLPLLSALTALQQLDLLLDAVPTHWYTQELPQALSKLTGLRSLRVSTQSLLAQGRQVIGAGPRSSAEMRREVGESVQWAAALRPLTKLTKLAYSGMRVDAAEAQELSQRLQQLSGLQLLSLRGLHSVVHFTGATDGALLAVLSEDFMQTRDEAWSALSDGLAACTALTSLDLHGCVLTQEERAMSVDTEYLAKALPALKQLKRLHGAGVNAPVFLGLHPHWLLPTISHLTQLTALGLGSYQFRDAGQAAEHAQLLAKLTNLQVCLLQTVVAPHPCNVAGTTAVQRQSRTGPVECVQQFIPTHPWSSTCQSFCC